MQHATHCVQHATRNTQHATCTMHHATWTMQHATHCVQHATCTMQHTACRYASTHCMRCACEARARVWACACVCACASVHDAFVRARACKRVRACVRACVGARARVSICNVATLALQRTPRRTLAFEPSCGVARAEARADAGADTAARLAADAELARESIASHLRRRDRLALRCRPPAPPGMSTLVPPLPSARPARHEYSSTPAAGYLLPPSRASPLSDGARCTAGRMRMRMRMPMPYYAHAHADAVPYYAMLCRAHAVPCHIMPCRAVRMPMPYRRRSSGFAAARRKRDAKPTVACTARCAVVRVPVCARARLLRSRASS
jgi:hypothetical protein